MPVTSPISTGEIILVFHGEGTDERVSKRHRPGGQGKLGEIADKFVHCAKLSATGGLRESLIESPSRLITHFRVGRAVYDNARDRAG